MMLGGNHFENRRIAPKKKRTNERPPKRVSANRKRPIDAGVGTPRFQLDSRKTLPMAKRIVTALVRLTFAALVTGGVLALGVLAYRHATESDYFQLETANIAGNKRLSAEEISDVAGLIEEKNIFKIDLAAARKALLSHPWITGAELSRRLPDTINVEVIEREAVAMVNLDVLYLVDDMGKVFKRWVRGDPVPAPIVTGISREHYIESPKEVETILCDAIDLAGRYRIKGLGKTAPLDEIHVEAGGGFSLTVGADPIYVRFGKGPYRTKLARLSTLLTRLNLEQKRAAMIFFDNRVRPDRITVKLKNGPSTYENPRRFDRKVDAKKIMSKI